MSTVYYIIDKKIEKEIKDFSDFFENKIISYIEDTIEKYCAKTDGKYINNDYTEEVLDELIPKVKYSQPNDDNYMFRIGHIWYGDKKPRFIWGQFHLDGFFIYDFKSFKDFF